MANETCTLVISSDYADRQETVFLSSTVQDVLDLVNQATGETYDELYVDNETQPRDNTDEIRTLASANETVHVRVASSAGAVCTLVISSDYADRQETVFLSSTVQDVLNLMNQATGETYDELYVDNETEPRDNTDEIRTLASANETVNVRVA